MTHIDHNPNARRSDMALTGLDLDAFLIDDQFDDVLDRQIADLRESLADFRNV
jgi:hypothetical protein